VEGGGGVGGGGGGGESSTCARDFSDGSTGYKIRYLKKCNAAHLFFIYIRGQRGTPDLIRHLLCTKASWLIL